MPSKTYYKVVRIFRDGKKVLGIYSCCVVHEFNVDHDDIVEYKIDEWVSPKIKNSKLFVFGILAHAKRFKSSCYNDNIEIFECEVKDPRKVTKICTCPSHDWGFWAENSRLPKDMIGKAPLGSIGCTAAKLTKKIKFPKG
jgi:hypothetical protein